MVATFFLQRTTAFILFLIVPSLQISCFRKTKEKQYAKYDLNKRIAARLIWQLVIHSCVIFAYIISRRDGENKGFVAGVSLPPSLLARPLRFPRAQNPLSLPFQTPATQARHLHTYFSPIVRYLYESPASRLYSRAIAVVLKKTNKQTNKRPTNSRGGGIISMSFHDSALHFFPNWNFSFLAKAPLLYHPY